ncbi:hypothetical protein POL68_18180 [Stigmatella sp. ncwal1]|uniref:Uncharacterized protein n=1 Tax=Stigmatella ashevillensis TaxID=2995309 RepID=A0ABT5D9U7_9BACT|nr:hypothetical protein [Stigmatella ashevillena]MDC0710411.1 hypothetical protein [Stigmatella ashevillena]
MPPPDLRGFVEGLHSTGREQHPPAIVLTEDYRQRTELAVALKDEADVYGIQLREFPSIDDLLRLIPELSAVRGDGAIILVDTDRGAEWGSWLEASRERLPDWFQLVLILIMPTELPRLAAVAPSFFSWVKTQVVSGTELMASSTGGDSVMTTLDEFQVQTGMTPQQFVEAWTQGRLPDNFRNSSWLNLAMAVLGALDV